MLHLIQMCSSKLTDPNPELKNVEWSFVMHAVEYVMGALTIQFYCAHLWAVGLSWVVSLLGLALLIPTHQFYTVDVLQAVISTLTLFLLFHWYTRTTQSITKRAVLEWFERDALQGLPQRIRVDSTLSGTSAGGNYNPVTTVARPPDRNSISSTESPYVQAFTVPDRGSSKNEPPSALEYVHILNDQSHPKGNYETHGFRVPTLVGEEFQRHEFEVVLLARQSSRAKRIYHPPVVSLVSLLVAAAAALLVFALVKVAKDSRPSHREPTADDWIHNTVWDVTTQSANVILYLEIAAVSLFILANRKRYVIIRRTSLIFFLVSLVRLFTVAATLVPDPAKKCLRPDPKGGTCGDLIFSGHAVGFLLAALVIHEYAPFWWMATTAWTTTAAGLILVVASKLHYTRDVLLAVLVTLSIFHLLRVAVFNRPDRMKSGTLLSELLREWEFDFYLLKVGDYYGPDGGVVDIANNNNNNETDSNSERGYRTDTLEQPA